jgi:6-pyruvoyltetrahydropterin/6-carboxytetrahydropterin synthase
MSDDQALTVSVMKRIAFCAGHRLMGHGGKCEHFHGHNYVAEFYCTAPQLDHVGRIIDFAELGALLKDWIDEHWDHGFLLHEQDENGIAAIQQVHPCKAYVLPYNPTAENLARYLIDDVAPKLFASRRWPVTATRVVVWETDSSCAEVVRSGVTTPPAESWREETHAGV